MAEHPSLTALLRAAVDDLPGGAITPPGPQLAERARRRLRVRRGIGVAAACAAVLAVTLPVTLLSNNRDSRPVPVTPVPTAVSPDATAARLAHGRWQDLAESPLAARSEAAAVWSGEEMLVWGGFVNSERPRYFNDGAAYDPGTNGWRMLPESPLSPRRDPASAWTGGELFVWGGADSTGTGTADDGAAYNPTTNSWRRLPKAPIAGRLDAQTFAVDGKVIVFGGHPAVTTASDRVMLDGAVYDSDADRWRPLPPAPRTDGHDVDAIVAAPAGGRLYAVLQWHRTTRNADGSGSTVGGYDAASLDLARGAWSRSDPPPTAAGLTALLPAADQLLLPAAPYVMFGAHGPPQMDLHGLARDPSGTWRQLTHGPADDLRGQSVWTGAALLTFNTGTYTSSGNSFSLPGNAAAWDPEADRWEPLPNAGWYADEPAAVWTGDTLLMWGSMYRVNGSSNPTPGPPIAHGLSYSAAGSGKIKVIGHFAAGATGSVVSGQRVTVLDGLGRSFPMFGGGELVATASTDEDGNFTLLLPAGEYTVGAYTVSFARSRIPCVTRNLVVHAEGPTPTLALSCERANASTSPS